MYIKKIILIIILLILLFILNKYYLTEENLSKKLKIKYDIIPLIVLNSDSFETTVDEMVLSRYLYNVYCFDKYYINSELEYSFCNEGINIINIEVRNKAGTSNRDVAINVKAKPVEYIEIIKEVEVIKEVNNYITESNSPSSQNTQVEITGIKDIRVLKDCDINELSYLLSKDIIADGNVSIDFTDINLSKCGDYKAYYYYKDNIYSCSVTVYE